MSSSRVFWSALIVVATAGMLTLAAQWPTTVTGSDVAESTFSGQRAVTALERVLSAAGGPHPVGTEANRRARDEIARQLEALGWTVERQRGVGCRRMRTCAAVENLIARRSGEGSGPAVVLASHTDSVPAAPGAGDDGIGIAVSLEVARNLAAGPDLARPVWLLLDEGEEMGLLGAELFTRRSAPGSIGAVVNLEARGTEGPAWMFEVSEGGGDLVAAYGRSVPMPTTSSIAYAVYRRMPNDTDLTVFKEAGWLGLGLGIIDGGARYHTPRDDLGHLSVASVQRMGDTALALARELAAGSLPPERSEAVFFDLAARWTVRWPAGWTPWLGALALLAVGAGLGRDREHWTAASLVGGVARAVAGVLLAGLVGWVVLLSLRALGSFPFAFPATLTWATWAAVLFGAAATLASVGLRRRGAAKGASGGRHGVFLLLATVALVIGWLEPAAAYPWVLAAGVGGLGAVLRPDLPPFGSVAAALVSCVLLVPLVRVLPVGLGPVGLVGSAGLAAWIVLPLAPLMPAGVGRARAPWLLATLGLAAAVGAVVVEPSTPDVPRPLSLRYLAEEGADEARLAFVGPGSVPPALLAFGDAEPLGGDLPGNPAWPALRIAGDRSLLGPEVELLSRTGSQLRLAVRSPRGSWSLLVEAPAGTSIRTVAWPGLEARTAEPAVDAIRLQAVGEEGVELVLEGRLEGELTVVDRALGLPVEWRPIAAARPDDVQPIGLGDLTEIVRRVPLGDLGAS